VNFPFINEIPLHEQQWKPRENSLNNFTSDQLRQIKIFSMKSLHEIVTLDVEGRGGKRSRINENKWKFNSLFCRLSHYAPRGIHPAAGVLRGNENMARK
jgi:hypothetical protein